MGLWICRVIKNKPLHQQSEISLIGLKCTSLWPAVKMWYLLDHAWLGLQSNVIICCLQLCKRKMKKIMNWFPYSNSFIIRDTDSNFLEWLRWRQDFFPKNWLNNLKNGSHVEEWKYGNNMEKKSNISLTKFLTFG